LYMEPKVFFFCSTWCINCKATWAWVSTRMLLDPSRFHLKLLIPLTYSWVHALPSRLSSRRNSSYIRAPRHIPRSFLLSLYNCHTTEMGPEKKKKGRSSFRLQLLCQRQLVKNPRAFAYSSSPNFTLTKTSSSSSSSLVGFSSPARCVYVAISRTLSSSLFWNVWKRMVKSFEFLSRPTDRGLWRERE
jgi:hypothetical protein